MDKEDFFYTFKKPKSDENQIKRLIDKFGPEATLGEILTYVQKNSPYAELPYLCPKCQGKGYTVTEYNGYPTGLPDSGWVYEPEYDYKVCDVCKGMGYTKTQMEPIIETKVVGYK